MASPESRVLELKTLVDALEDVAAGQQAAFALHVPGRNSLTYGDLGEQIRQVRARLGDWGIAPGDIVAGFMPGRAEMAVGCATLPASCTFAPLGAMLSVDSYAQLLARMGARAVVAPKGQEHPIRAAARRLGVAEIDVVCDPDAPAGLFGLELRPGSGPRRAARRVSTELAFVLTSSGTTGRPKLVPSTHRQALLYAKAARELLQYSPADIGCHLTPIHLGNGLRSGLINPLLAGLSIVCLPESDVDAFFRCIEQYQPTCLNAGFTLHRAILRRAPEYRHALSQSRFRFLRSGAGRLQPEEIDRLEQAFGAPLLIGYSSVEAAISHDPLPPRRRKPGAAGLPLLNEVAVLDAAGRISAAGSTGATGEIVVRGPLVFPGYLDDPDLTAASFTGEWFRTGDLGQIDQEGYVHVSGRLKEVINRGGEKVSPVEIDAILESLPGVKEAATFGIPHVTLGEEVVAALVQQGDAAMDEAQVIDEVRRRVGPTKAPRRIYFVDRIPRTGNGKVLRRELPRALGLDPGSTPPSAPSGGAHADAPVARSPLEAALAGIWASLLNVGNIGPDGNFFLLGGDSLHGVQLLAQVQELFGVELPIQSLFGEAITVAGMARAIETIRRESPANQNDTSITGRSPLAPAPRRERDAPMVLSHAQWRVWFLAQLGAGTAAYHQSRAHKLTGAVDAEAFRAGLQTLVERHEILRTTFSVIDDEPRQVAHQDLQLDFDCLDLSAPSGAGRDHDLSNLLAEIAQKPFDLESGPLARFRLIRVADDEHVFVRVWHHIISDGWSTGIFEREFSSAYRDLVEGRAPELPHLTLQYADYALWQRQWLSDEALSAQLTYWKGQLANLPTLDLPADRARPAVQTFRGTSVDVELPLALTEAVQELARGEGATLFMTLLTVFGTLLSRHCGQEDIAVGTPVANRGRSEIAGIIGPFANTLVLRLNLAGDPTVRDAIRTTKETALAAYAHQDVPFEKLVEELRSERSLSRNPLFQVLFSLQNTPGGGLHLPGVAAIPFKPAQETAKFDVSLSFAESPDGLQGRLEYNTDLFDAATARRLLEHYRVLLEGAVANPDLRLSQLPLLAVDEIEQVLVRFNDTAAEYPRTPGMHDLVARQAAATPDAPALIGERERLSYRELNAMSNRIAHFLMSRGAGPDVPVGICCHRNARLVAGILGILKAGSAYLPLDPGYPKERLQCILEDARPPIVLTHASLANDLPKFAGQPIFLDRDWDRIARESANDPAVAISPENLAYVLFTSGSTGRPKGAAIEHRTGTNFMQWANQIFTPQELAGVLFSTSVCFDVSLFEMFVTLSAGGRIIMADDLLHLAALKAKDQVTLINAVPSAVAELLRAGAIPPSTKTLNLAGEALPEQLVEQIHATTNVDKIYNLYGPTEASYVTYTPVRRGSPVTIGKPIANARVYILDAHRNPAPIGVPGELHVAGAGLARGYLDRPELTAEKFFSLSLGGEPPVRLYRTGDLGRFLPDGNIEFLGRIDNQVKIRGFRIEPGEIEAALDRHPAIHTSVVVAREDDPGEKRLIAYVVLHEGQSAVAGELRAFLKRTLPDYMLPSRFVFQARLPMLPSGKVDRRALPKPEAPRPDGEASVGPRNQQEYQLGRMWEDLLGVSPVGIRDDFFELGGDSLLAVRLMIQIEEVYGKKLSMSTLFAGPTVESMADAISRQPEDHKPSALVTVQPHGSKRPFFFLHGDYSGGGVYCLKLARYLGREQPFYSLQPLGLDGQHLPRTIEAMAEPYLNILRTVQPRGPYLLGGYCAGGLAAFEIAQRLRAQGERTDLLLIDTLVRSGSFRSRHGSLAEIARFFGRGANRIPAPAPADGDANDLMRSLRRKDTHYRRLSRRYVAHPYPGRVTLIRAADHLHPMDDQTLGWRQVAGEVDLHLVPGDHATCLTRHLDVVAENLKSSLDKLESLGEAAG